MSVNPFLPVRAGYSRKIFAAALLAVWVLCAVALQGQQQASQNQPAQVTNPAQSNKDEAARPTQEKKDDAAIAAAKAKAHHFDRVVIIVLENGDYETAVKDPNLAALATKGASFSNFHALFHPSYPNYIAMVAGTDFGVSRRERFFADRQVDFPNDAAHVSIADRLIANGLDFKNYAEELPDGSCPFGIDSHRAANRKIGDYARKHVPFMSFREVQEKWCDRVVRVDSTKGNSLLGIDDNVFVKDAKAGLVAYSFYSPNMNNDGHNTSVSVGATWVRDFLEKTFSEKLRKGTLVVVTFDESEHNSDNRIYTLFLGDMVKDSSQLDPKVLDRRYTHYNVLRTIEDNFALQPLAEGDRTAEPITDIWK